MNNPSLQLTGKTNEKKNTGKVKAGLWLIRLCYAALTISGAIDLFFAFDKQGIFDDYFSAIMRLTAGLIVFSAELFIWKGRTIQAAWVAITGTIIALFIMGFFTSITYAWLLGIVIGLLLSLIAIQLMPPQWMGQGIFIAFSGGSLVAVTDYFHKIVEYNPSLADTQVIILYLLSIILAIILFVRFSNYPVTAKLVLAIATLSTIILNGLGMVITTVMHSQVGITPEIILQTNAFYLLGSQMGIFLSSLVALLLAHFITRPLVDIVKVAELIARDGDLSQHTRKYYQDEVGLMAEAFNNMVDTLQKMAQHADLIAQGDLTVSFSPRSPKDMLGNALGLMTQNLVGLVAQVSRNSDQVNLSSGDLANAAHLAGQAATQISQTMDQIAQGAIQQAEVASKTAGSVDQMISTIEGVEQGIRHQSDSINQAEEYTHQIIKAIQQVSTDAKMGVARAAETMQEANKGALTIQQTIAGMGAIQTKVAESAQKVLEMRNRAGQISNILEVIEEIGSQINLLALNAAIEAARAGEQGKGFSVVADEVRKLAEKSKTATKEISNLILSINSTTQEAVTSMENGLEEVKSGMERAGSAGQALEKIIGTVTGMQQQVNQIADSAVVVDSSVGNLTKAMDQVSSIVHQNTSATNEMTKWSAEVSRSVENIASISEENSASVEEVSASVDGMSTQVSRVNDSAQTLTAMAHNLSSQLQQFRL